MKGALHHHHPESMTTAVVTGSAGGIGSATVPRRARLRPRRERARGDGPVETCTEEAWDGVLEANLRSMFLYCKHAVPLLRTAGGGAIVTVSSVLGLVGGDEDFATHAYAASKAGVVGLTRAMAATYAKDGIRCNVVCPGLIETPMSRRAQDDARIRARLPELQPLTGTFGRPDVAAAAVYLATAPFVTGAVLTVDGGWTAR